MANTPPNVTDEAAGREKELPGEVPVALPQAQETVAESSREPELSSIAMKGIAVFSGVALGQAQILSEGDLEIPRFPIDGSQTRAESTRLRAAVTTVAKELEELSETLAQNEDTPPEAIAFSDLHRQILADESLVTDTQAIIRERLVNAEWALSLRMEELRKAFDAIDNEYLAERGDDVALVVERIQRVLSGRRRPADTVRLTMSDEKIILIADDLNPADILILKRRRDVSIAGLVTASGSPTSHAAILARSLEIPTLVSVEGATENISSDDVVLLDADHGVLTVHPDPSLLPQVAQRIRDLNNARIRQKRLNSRPAETKDGVKISLCANIALPEDVRDAERTGADGIGLFRSEFLFMNRPTLPSEDEQYETYLRVIRAMKGKPVTIRTMDLGGDKLPSHEALESLNLDDGEEVPNPALGRRAIRFSIHQPELFLTQLRAILRAAVDSNVQIMLPLLSRPSEIAITRGFIRKAREQLTDRGIACADKIALGGMIEVPAAAIALPSFLKDLDFISLGTNDLIQYTLAVDRHDPAVSELYDPLHPAVLSLLYSVIKTAVKAKKPVSICGEIAGDPTLARLLIGMGARRLSMESGRIPELKEMILAMSCAEAEKLLQRIHRMHNPISIHEAVNSSTQVVSYTTLQNDYPVGKSNKETKQNEQSQPVA